MLHQISIDLPPTSDVVAVVVDTRLRPEPIRRLGAALHPSSVTDAWYAADCPPSFAPRQHGVSRLDCMAWRVACLLRGVHL